MIFLTNDNDLISVANTIRKKANISSELVFNTGFIDTISNLGDNSNYKATVTFINNTNNDIGFQGFFVYEAGESDFSFIPNDGSTYGNYIPYITTLGITLSPNSTVTKVLAMYNNNSLLYLSRGTSNCSVSSNIQIVDGSYLSVSGDGTITFN
jgi:hypothetical protein